MRSHNVFECNHEAFVESCPSCVELASIERAFAEDRDTLIQSAQVPSSAIVWWRAQMRSRREAARVATEPITVVQGLTIACGIGVLLAAVSLFSPTFAKMAAWFQGTSLPDAPSLPAVALPSVAMMVEALANPIVIATIAAIGFSAIVLPVALYFAFHEGE